jgi:hypothetical protein
VDGSKVPTNTMASNEFLVSAHRLNHMAAGSQRQSNFIIIILRRTLGESKHHAILKLWLMLILKFSSTFFFSKKSLY